MNLYTIDKEYSTEIEIKKSRFIATIIPVQSSDEVNEALRLIRKKYYDATHNCYAYVFLDNGVESIKASDDGEPSGTAGVIILNVINQNNLKNVMIVVTRYFGGIKLGAGGLVRAYSNSASEVVKLIDKKEIIEKVNLIVTINYQSVNEVVKLLDKYEHLNKTFDSNVCLSYMVPKRDIDALKLKLIEITKNNINILVK